MTYSRFASNRQKIFGADDEQTVILHYVLADHQNRPVYKLNSYSEWPLVRQIPVNKLFTSA